MTLPASGPISMSQVSVELGLSATYNLSLDNSWVRYLGQVAGSGTICSFLNLQGKTGTFQGVAPSGTGALYAVFPSAPWFGGILEELDAFSPSQGNQFIFTFAVAPNWPNNIKITNLSTGVSATFTPQSGGTTWVASPWQANMIRANASDTYLIQPT